MRQAMPLNSNENESDNEMHLTAAGGARRERGREETGGEGGGSVASAPG